MGSNQSKIVKDNPGLFQVNQHSVIIEHSYIYRHYRFTRVPYFIIRFQSKLNITNSELVFLVHCYTFGNKCWASVQTIAERMDSHRRTVKRYVKSLTDKGHINLIYRITNGDTTKILPKYNLDIDEGWHYTSCIYDLTPIEKQAFKLAIEKDEINEEEAKNNIIKRLEKQLGDDVHITIDKNINRGNDPAVTTPPDKNVTILTTNLSKELYKMKYINIESSSGQCNVNVIHNVLGPSKDKKKDDDDNTFSKDPGPKTKADRGTKDCTNKTKDDCKPKASTKDGLNSSQVNNTSRNDCTNGGQCSDPHEGKTSDSDLEQWVWNQWFTRNKNIDATMAPPLTVPNREYPTLKKIADNYSKATIKEGLNKAFKDGKTKQKLKYLLKCCKTAEGSCTTAKESTNQTDPAIAAAKLRRMAKYEQR